MEGTQSRKAFEVLAGIANPHMAEAAALFEQKRRSNRQPHGLWRELVYCILAGSQVKFELARKATSELLRRIKPDDSPASFAAGAAGERVLEIAQILKSAGYRYHTRKADALRSAAEAVVKGPNDWIEQLVASEPTRAERILVSEVNGVGKKIANHWLRNAGADTCTVDLHLARLFHELGLVHVQKLSSLKKDEFRKGVDLIRGLATQMGSPLADTQYALWLGAKSLGPDDYARYRGGVRSTAGLT